MCVCCDHFVALYRGRYLLKISYNFQFKNCPNFMKRLLHFISSFSFFLKIIVLIMHLDIVFVLIDCMHCVYMSFALMRGNRCLVNMILVGLEKHWLKECFLMNYHFLFLNLKFSFKIIDHIHDGWSLTDNETSVEIIALCIAHSNNW